MIIFTCQKTFFLIGDSYSEQSMNIIYTEEKNKTKEKTLVESEQSKFTSIKEIKETLEENIYTNMIRRYFSSNFNDNLQNLSIVFESILQNGNLNQNVKNLQQIQDNNQQIKVHQENEIENVDLVTNVDDTESIAASSIFSNENPEKAINNYENNANQNSIPNGQNINSELYSSILFPKSKKKSKKKKPNRELDESEIIAPVKIENKTKGKNKKQQTILSGKGKNIIKKDSMKKSCQKGEIKNEKPNTDQATINNNNKIQENRIDKNSINLNQNIKPPIPSNLSLSTPIENSLNLTQTNKLIQPFNLKTSDEFQQYEMFDSMYKRKAGNYKARPSITYVKKEKKLENDQYLRELNVTNFEKIEFQKWNNYLNSEEENKTSINKDKMEVYLALYQNINPIYICCLDPRLKQKINFDRQFIEQLEMDMEIFNEKNEKFTNDFKPFLNRIVNLFQSLITSISEEFSKVVLTIYGSHSTGLALTTSDLDITIRNIEIHSKDSLYHYMDLIAKKIQELPPIKSIRSIKTASVPVLKIVFINRS